MNLTTRPDCSSYRRLHKRYSNFCADSLEMPVSDELIQQNAPVSVLQHSYGIL